MLHFEDDRPFSQGACTFLYRPATEQETTPRIIVRVQIQGIQTNVVLDTGGVYLVCNPQIVELLDLDPVSDIGKTRLVIRGTNVPGSLYRLPLILLAEKGQSIELEVTAFVPRLRPNQLWDLPSFMGLEGCLERLRFAIDPTTNTFYFGSIAGED